MGKGALEEDFAKGFGGIYVGEITDPEVKASFEAADLTILVGSLKSDFNSGEFSCTSCAIEVASRSHARNRQNVERDDNRTVRTFSLSCFCKTTDAACADTRMQQQCNMAVRRLRSLFEAGSETDALRSQNTPASLSTPCCRT
jgi:TPP-dependent 2-oxoacid decarboxylase